MAYTSSMVQRRVGAGWSAVDAVHPPPPSDLRSGSPRGPAVAECRIDDGACAFAVNGGECSLTRSTSVSTSRHEAPSYCLGVADAMVGHVSTRAVLNAEAPRDSRVLFSGWMRPSSLHLGHLPRLHWYQRTPSWMEGFARHGAARLAAPGHCVIGIRIGLKGDRDPTGVAVIALAGDRPTGWCQRSGRVSTVGPQGNQPAMPVVSLLRLGRKLPSYPAA